MALARARAGAGAGGGAGALSWSDVAWAVHAPDTEGLLDLCQRALAPTSSGGGDWNIIGALCAPLWARALTPLRAKVEAAAKAAYLRRKDPEEAALLYIALGRANVLAGLFKASGLAERTS